MRNPSKQTIKRIKQKSSPIIVSFWEYDLYYELTTRIRRMTKGKIAIAVAYD